VTLPISAPAPRRGVRSRRLWRFSLRWLVIGAALLLSVAAAAGALATWSLFRTTGAAFQRSRHDAVKVVAAQSMATAAEGIDAGLTELLLAHPTGAVPPAEGAGVRSLLQTFDSALLAAGQSSVPGQPDADTVAAVTAAWGDYRFTVAALLQSLYLGQSESAHSLSQQAGSLLNDQLRPAVVRLDRLDRQDIDRSTATARDALARGQRGLAWLGWGLSGALLVSVLGMAWLTHRRLNPGLLLGLLGTLVVLLLAAGQVRAAQADVRQALTGHFDRLHLAVQMEQALSATHSAGNRWLIDREQAVSEELAFGHNDRLVRQYLDLLARDPQLTGWDPAAFRQSYDDFFTQDRHMREAYLGGDPAAALRLSREAVLPDYRKLAASVAGLRQQEQSQFEVQVAAATGRLSRDEGLLWPLLLVALLIAAGLGTRLRDF